MELELKHLAPYLPYGLKMYYYDPVVKISYIKSLTGVDVDCIRINGDVEYIPIDYKPILSPMSDLIKPVLSKVIYREPLRHLKHGGTDLDQLRISSDCCGEIEYSCCDNEGHETRYNVKEMTFTQRFNGDTRYYKNQYESMCRLFEWHFDVFGLIEKGLAIDINTLKHE